MYLVTFVFEAHTSFEFSATVSRVENRAGSLSRSVRTA